MNAPHDPEMQALLNMTSETIGKDLLSALVSEIKLLPDVWQKLAQHKQEDVIERLRKCVEDNVRMACHTIASEGRSVVMDKQGKPEQPGLPSPDDVKPSDDELQHYYETGYKAAENGSTKEDCPVVRSELVAEWVRGFNQWHEDNPA